MVLDLEFILGIYPALLQATIVTLQLTLVSLSIGLVVGFFTGWAKTSNRPVLKAAATAYVEVIRGTPLVIQIFVIFFAFPAILPSVNSALGTNIVVPDFWRVALALIINTGAYQGEIFRGGFQSIAEGQVEAGRAVGMTYWQTMRFVVVPQTFRIITPPLMNEFIIMLQSSALASIIGFKELTGKAQELAVRSGQFVDALIAAAIIYIIITFVLAQVIQYVENRYRVPGLGIPRRTAGG